MQYNLDFKIEFKACAREIYSKLRNDPPLLISVTGRVPGPRTKEISMSHT